MCVDTWQGWLHSGDRGRPTIWPPFKKHVAILFMPRYVHVCTSDSAIHFSIIVVGAMLALDGLTSDGWHRAST